MTTKENVLLEVSEIISFIKEQLSNDIAEGVRKSNITLTKDELTKLVFYAQTSVQNSFGKASLQLEKLQERINKTKDKK